jgi:hypothetical protein
MNFTINSVLLRQKKLYSKIKVLYIKIIVNNNYS